MLIGLIILATSTLVFAFLGLKYQKDSYNKDSLIKDQGRLIKAQRDLLDVYRKANKESTEQVAELCKLTSRVIKAVSAKKQQQNLL